jgi:hypothetical protein
MKRVTIKKIFAGSVLLLVAGAIIFALDPSRFCPNGCGLTSNEPAVPSSVNPKEIIKPIVIGKALNISDSVIQFEINTAGLSKDGPKSIIRDISVSSETLVKTVIGSKDANTIERERQEYQSEIAQGGGVTSPPSTTEERTSLLSDIRTGSLLTITLEDPNATQLVAKEIKILPSSFGF